MSLRHYLEMGGIYFMKKNIPNAERLGARIRRDWIRNRSLYIMVIPVLLFYILFHYKPMYGTIMAFMDYSPRLGFAGREWVGFDNFIRFFRSPYCWQVIRNTLILSVYGIVICFPAPIILALLINEVKSQGYKKVVQTVTYLPHFISLVVVTGIIKDFTMSTGLITDIVVFFGGERQSLIQNPNLYRTIYIVSDIWQGIGWGSIIYLSALAGVSEDLYEAAAIDGAGRWKKLVNVTIPAIMPTIVTMLIMRLGQVLGSNYEKTILLYNEATYETADVISSYVYRVGLLDRDWGYSAAIGLFNSLINVILLLITNKISKKLTETSLW